MFANLRDAAQANMKKMPATTFNIAALPRGWRGARERGAGVERRLSPR